MPEDRPQLDGTQDLAASLKAAVEVRDEERFTGLVTAVLHEPDEPAIALLEPYLGVPGPIGRTAAHGLLMLGEPALEPLLFALAAPTPEAKLNAAWALGSIRDPKAIAALGELAADPQSSEALVHTALASLAELADKRATPKLRPLLESERMAPYWPDLCHALGHMGDTSALLEIAPHMKSDRPELRLRAAEAMVRLLDRRGWPVLYEILRGEDKQGDSMVAALRELGELSSALSTFVGDEGYHLRREAAEILGTCGDPQAVPHLLEALKDINPWVRGAAAYAIGRLGDRTAMRALLNTLEDSSAWVRQCGARGLGLLRDVRAVKGLEKHLFDADIDVARAVQEALDEIAAFGR